MNKELVDWIHDDITWCNEENCPLVGCMRNPKNMRNRSGLHSYAAFRNTEECPIYVMEKQADLEREGGKP